MTFLACTQISPETSLLGKAEKTVKNYLQNLAIYYLSEPSEPRSFKLIYQLLQKNFPSLSNEYYSAIEQNQSDGTLFATSVALKTVSAINPLSSHDLASNKRILATLANILSLVPQNMPSLLYRAIAVPHVIPGGALFNIVWPVFNPEEVPTKPSPYENPIFIAKNAQDPLSLKQWALKIKEITATHRMTTHQYGCSVEVTRTRVGIFSSFDFQIAFENGSSVKAGPLYTYNPPAGTGDIGPQSTTTRSEAMTFCREQLNRHIRGHSTQLLRILG